MKRFIRTVSMVGLVSALQIVYADSITDTYNTGDTLTTTTLDNIKSAVNDNDSRVTSLEGSQASQDTNISNLDAAQQALQTNDVAQDLRLDALEAVSGPVLKQWKVKDSLGNVVSDFIFQTGEVYNQTTGVFSEFTTFGVAYDGIIYQYGWNSTTGLQGGSGSPVYYSGTNCTSTAYVAWENSTGSNTAVPFNSVLEGTKEGAGGIFYTFDRAIPPTQVLPLSRAQYGNCTAYTGGQIWLTTAVVLPISFNEPLDLVVE